MNAYQAPNYICGGEDSERHARIRTSAHDFVALTNGPYQRWDEFGENGETGIQGHCTACGSSLVYVPTQHPHDAPLPALLQTVLVLGKVA
jgi:hypothetical protein